MNIQNLKNFTYKMIVKPKSIQIKHGFTTYDAKQMAADYGLLGDFIEKQRSVSALKKVKKEMQKNLKPERPLSEKEKLETLKELFPSGLNNLNLRQKNVGDCYLIAAIKSLMIFAEKQKDENYLGNYFTEVIRKKTDGSYRVAFPKHKEFRIDVSRDEAQFGQIIGKGTPSEIRLKPVESDLGIRIIERAYGRLSKQLSVFKELSKVKKEKIDDTLVVLDGGCGDEALEILTGWKPLSVCKKNSMESLLNKYSNHPENYILTAGTVSAKNAPTIFHVITTKTGQRIIYMDEEKNLVPEHAYVLKSIDSVKKLITILNPYDTSYDILLSYNRFLECFSNISGVKVPANHKLLN